ncbi:hypothetical protein HY633_01450 [Candidatus Uhrbacteria bacterium]|nr:hypothetical protein [Candidatus Uhrbacteria bacterium]
MTAARALLALVAVVLWSAAALAGGRAALLEGWRFDVADPGHWRYLGQGLEAVWTRGAAMRWGFLLALAGAGAAWLGGAVVAARAIAGMDDERVMSVGRVALAGVRWPFMPLKWLLGLVGALLVRAARGAEGGTPDREKTGRPAFHATPQPAKAASPAPNPPPILLGGAADAGQELDPTESVVVSEPDALDEVPADLGGPGGGVPRPDDAGSGGGDPRTPGGQAEGDTPALQLRPTAAVGFTVLDLQAAVNAWLARQGWSVFPDLFVNADLGGTKWDDDWFDSDPGAVVALVAGSLAEIHLVMFADLAGRDWRAAPWDPERQGIASWRTTEDNDGRDIPCPLSLAIRARERCLAHHGAYLAGAGYDSLSLINLVLILTRGAVVNFDDVAASWDLTDVSIARLEPTEDGMVDDLPLRNIFGAPPEEPLDPFVIKHLKEGSRAAIKLAGPAAA